MQASLATNPRTTVKAAIKRASAAARASMRQLDRDLQKQVADVYKQASVELQQLIMGYADSGGSVRLEVMRDLLGQVNQRLNQLTATRNQLLDEGLAQAAQLGVQPFATSTEFITRAADDALNFVVNFVHKDGLQLSDRLWRLDNGAQQAVGDAIKQAVIQGKSASQAANDFMQRGQPVPTDIIKKQGAANANRIARETGAQLLRVDGNPRDHALGVFRTEINRAHGEAYMLGGEEHPDFGGWKFLLSPRHPRKDICDMHASVNRYGLGPGVYPSREKTPWPAHPKTLSFVEIVFIDEITDEDREGKEDRITWLKKQPSWVQESVLNSRKKRAALQRDVLKENEIATPWRVLKKRYERRGHDTTGWGLTNEQGSNIPPPTTPGAPGGLKFKPAKTSREAAKWAIDNNLADYADYKGVHAEVANDWNRSIVEHLNEFPQLRGGLQFIGSVQARNTFWYQFKVDQYLLRLQEVFPDKTLADLRKIAARQIKKPRTPGNVWAYSTSTRPITGVTVNAKWAKDPGKFTAAIIDNMNSRYHPKGSGTIKSIIDHELGHELDRLIGIRKDPQVIDLFRSWMRADPGGEQLSRYAQENIAEFIAEAWAEYRNNPKPRELAQKIGDLIKKRYKEKSNER